MLMSVRVGTNDPAKARQFYDATFAAIGGPASLTPPASPMAIYKIEGAPFLVGPALEAPASAASGGTILFTAADEAQVSAWHAAGVENGGTCEGPPGPRPQARGRFGAYLRDPDGNKLGCYVGNLFG